MADTKWLDPTGWTLADWEDDELTVLVDHLWAALKGAGDERQAFAERTHSSGFDADYIFPDFSALKNLFNGTSSSPNNATKIKNNLMPDNLYPNGNSSLVTVETSTIKADGTAITSAEANYLTYAEILTGPLDYASGTLLHMTDTSNGINKALLKMAWVVQWYRFMSYTKYYALTVDNVLGGFFSDRETRQMTQRVTYDYNSTTDIASPSAFYTNPPNSPVNLYVTNDLNESAPFSTEQDVWDYTVATFEGQIATADWQSSVGLSHRAEAIMTIDRDLGPDDTTDYRTTLSETQFRFKVNESKRAASPETFQAALHYYFYITNIDDAFYDFNALGVGLNEDESKFNELVADGSGWYYLAPTTAPDFDLFTPPTRPTTTTEVVKREGYRGRGLNEDSSTHDIFVETNDPAGTAFEYYNP